MVTSNDYLLQAELVSQTLIPADNVINTFAFVWDGSGEPTNHDFENCASNVGAFYQSWSGQRGGSITNLTDSHAKIYRLSDPTPRAPVSIQPLNIGAASTSVRYPQEVACCLSYTAATESGVPPARRRGRIFLGPLTASTGENDPSGYVRPSETFRETLATAATNLAQMSSDDDWVWSVWSRVDNELFTIVGGWIENEYDTQRRRGPSGSARTPWPLPPG